MIGNIGYVISATCFFVYLKLTFPRFIQLMHVDIIHNKLHRIHCMEYTVIYLIITQHQDNIKVVSNVLYYINCSCEHSDISSNTHAQSFYAIYTYKLAGRVYTCLTLPK